MNIDGPPFRAARQHVDEVDMLQSGEKGCKARKAVLRMRELTMT